MSYLKSRRRQEFGKISLSLANSLLSFVPLVPYSSSPYVSVTEKPIETTWRLAGVFFMLNFCFIRHLFLEDLIPRKGQAANRNSSWSWPDAGLHMVEAVAACYVGIILFGAPIFDSVSASIVLSLFLASVAFTPFIFTYAQPFEEICKLLQSDKSDIWSMEKACLLPGLAAVSGAWCGAIVIPLDWDRSWQKWPIPCCYGALLAYGVGNLIWSSLLISRFFERPSQKSIPKSD